ncbi:FAD-linked oxidoreductase [Microbacterium endophyticum]|uniref:FAD-linked oxidoreductase n=1 Tax=Microbacterium endophyticum TaxID=1526412 RepID=A0A7W4YL68_9MICO|nr:D-arabinono-1,4-lactone oxidase [Microbacterium endophyticum]MBB2974858.1 FAD-linked oxidoreductase [Microbacterium endophyticum]NIK37155.1 FAD-linked oxidoreductase [Microbacterium endophyticum]
MTRPGGVWRNWARTAAARPQRVEYPTSIGAVQRAVRAAATRGLLIKAVGAGHSFTDIAATTGVLLDLADLTGLVAIDRERGRASFRAGTRLHQIPRLLAPYGLAMANLGDIDRQTIAGAISTGTHGTGADFGGISTQVVGLKVVTADGELLTIDEEQNAELLPAFALSLGALGVLVEITLQCVPAFVLHALEAREPLETVANSIEQRALAADHFELYWFPHTDIAHTKTNTRLPESAPRRPLRKVSKWLDEEVLSNGVWGLACAAGTAAPPIVPRLTRFAAASTGSREYTDASTRVFTQHRGVRFVEMEYAVARSSLDAVFAEVRATITQSSWRISFPLEVRVARADDLWLSTAHAQDTGYIAVHRYWRERPGPYFRAMEEIFLAHGGRPHWGKLHTTGRELLQSRYPRFTDFVSLRDRLDPQRRFQNAYLARVLGE